MNELRAIIADDEGPLRDFLRARLAEAWPELIICGEARNGKEALELIELHSPHIAFLDIRMPGLTGMEVAEKIHKACRVVFVTAYDEYAVDAFEREAVDYLLKPVSRERLQKTINRLKEVMGGEDAGISPDILRRLMQSFSAEERSSHLQYVRVQHGDGVRLLPTDEVIYFKAQDKYTMVITGDGESLIRRSIRDLEVELDSEKFWRIHRGTIVNVRFIAKVSRSLTGKGVLKLKDRSETLPVSNRYMHLFRQM